eukprot:8930890-Lingulodinium_polyedra.AAC.1
MGTKEVLNFWGLASCETELGVRRLTWYQAWAKEPEQHLQEIASLFGSLKADKERGDPALENGEVTAAASPWVRRFMADFEWASK